MIKRNLILIGGFLLGVGVGGLADGIFFHQILQWHHMVCQEASCASQTVLDLENKIYWDGIFHAFCWISVLIGLAFLSRALDRPSGVSSKSLWGALLFGWGMFNMGEGLINHHLLSLHHVRFGPDQAIWDGLFLLLSLFVAMFGWRLARSRR